MNPTIVGVQFQAIGKVYHFDATGFSDLQVGDFAIVDTSRGRQLGEIVQFVANPSPPPEGAWKPIRRKATPRDLVLRQLWQKKELEATINCRAKLSEYKITGVKIVTCEYSFDGMRLSFFYSTENEAKIELKNLRNAMQRIYPRPRVEMHQIGPRDVAKLLGGMGACGLETRCCSKFLTDFSPISIKMAKEQGISLSPTEITGMCGRLRCCLVYEYEQYVEARKVLPKRNKHVISPQGEGKVMDVYPLKGAVVVELENGTHVEFMADELQPWDELEILRRKSQEPCDRHQNGGCSCGKNTPKESNSDHPEDQEELFFQEDTQPPPPSKDNRPYQPRRKPGDVSDQRREPHKRAPSDSRRTPKSSSQGSSPSQNRPPKPKK